TDPPTPPLDTHSLHDALPISLPGAIYAMIAAGFGEETFFRGYLFERIGKRYGTGPWERAFAVALTSVFFGVAHYTAQGLAGAQRSEEHTSELQYPDHLVCRLL